MSKFNFLNDYHDGGHPDIIAALQVHPLEPAGTYGEDIYSKRAIEVIREEIKNPNADIHFVTGGTPANIVTLSAMLKPYESIIAPESSHIHVHEAGAIEATGHKINTVPAKDGKLELGQIKEVLDFHQDEHMVRPRVVFISQSTELGTLYSYKELKELSEFCEKNNLWLYADGARLGSALTSPNNDTTLEQFASLVDAFYIGGTKNGAIAAEAIVLCHPKIQKNFRYILKQKGALLAKGRFLGVQFQHLFENQLFYDLGHIANKKAVKLSTGIIEAGYKFFVPPMTNQIFPIFPNPLIEVLEKSFDFYMWEKISDTHTAIRLVTSWNTPDTSIENILTTIQSF